jgi:membrane associated rhomboid family serine protease
MLPIGDENAGRRIFPLVTYALIVINVIVFLIELASGDDFIIRWSFVPARFLANPGGDFITIFTSMFMHAGWLHILGNMLYLFIFGDNVEDAFGHVQFLVFYLICGIAATFAQLAFSAGSNIPNLGASGAIAGVLGAYLVMFPRSRVTVLMGYIVVPLPALIVIGFWFVLQFFSGLAAVTSVTTGAEEGGVAYMAHVGGFIAGLVLALIFRPRNRAAAAPR